MSESLGYHDRQWTARAEWYERGKIEDGVLVKRILHWINVSRVLIPRSFILKGGKERQASSVKEGGWGRRRGRDGVGSYGQIPIYSQKEIFSALFAIDASPAAAFWGVRYEVRERSNVECRKCGGWSYDDDDDQELSSVSNNAFSAMSTKTFKKKRLLTPRPHDVLFRRQGVHHFGWGFHQSFIS